MKIYADKVAFAKAMCEVYRRKNPALWSSVENINWVAFADDYISANGLNTASFPHGFAVM